jgi:hypothetical protein
MQQPIGRLALHELLVAGSLRRHARLGHGLDVSHRLLAHLVNDGDVLLRLLLQRSIIAIPDRPFWLRNQPDGFSVSRAATFCASPANSCDDAWGPASFGFSDCFVAKTHPLLVAGA